MKILFLHGWHSVPGGVKPLFLSKRGHEVVNPPLDDTDFDKAVSTAQTEYDRHKPDVIVGSSRGGSVAMNLDSGSTPLVLLCPAWKRWGSSNAVKMGTVILHAKDDDVVPISDSRELLRASSLPESALIVVGTDHRLAQSQPLNSMLIACEFAVRSKDWYSIYQWGRTARADYIELVASLITAWLSQIQLLDTGIRQSGFRVVDHRGQAKPKDVIGLNEKRLCRAFFNAGKVKGLGCVRDYEVPLKANRPAQHGNIDLLCEDGTDLLLVEVKLPSSNESVLKAVLQAFTYSALVASVRKTFLNDFDLRPETSLVPVVLTFTIARSGQQLRRLDDYPRFRSLLLELNRLLAQREVHPIRFLLVSGDDTAWDDILQYSLLQDGSIKVSFRDGFAPDVAKVVLESNFA